MKFTYEPEGFKDLVVIDLITHEDARGKFTEVYNEREFTCAKIPTWFCQDNESHSKKGVLRGLHFQKSPWAQGKLVRVSMGKAQDVVVDIRPESVTFGKWYSIVLDGTNMMYVPPGFAHGFLALEDCIFHYKCTALYNKEADSGIVFDDPNLSIKWMASQFTLSPKDGALKPFKQLEIF